MKNFRTRCCNCLLGFIWFLCAGNVLAATLADYALLPQYRSLALSPDGLHYALIARQDGAEYFVVINSITSDIVATFNAGEYSDQGIFFATNQDVIFSLAKTTSHRFSADKTKAYSLLVYNLQTKRMYELLGHSEQLRPMPDGKSPIAGIDAKARAIYLEAFDKNGAYNLYRAELDSGKNRLYARGSVSTRGWFIGDNGVILAREDVVEETAEQQIFSHTGGDWKAIYTRQTGSAEIHLQAVSAAKKRLLFTDAFNESVFSLDLHSGEIAGPFFHRPGRQIERLITDSNRTLVAVKYSGFIPAYQFTELTLNRLWQYLNMRFPASGVDYLSVTGDHRRILIRTGNGEHFLIERDNLGLNALAKGYPAIKQIARTKPIQYPSPGKLMIPAVLTLPTEPPAKHKPPLIVLLADTPDAYQNLQFNWLAQYLASRGYLVFQPNPRGTAGFGLELQAGGAGKWPQAVLQDIHAGIKTLLDNGYADPQRICLLGNFFGGTIALAAGASALQDYRCIIAINPITDLSLFLTRPDPEPSPAYRWQTLLDEIAPHGQMKAASPINNADALQAPVLLLHSDHNKEVSYRQSEHMQRALRRADKAVKLLSLPGFDHRLTDNDARLQALEAIDAFLRRHNPTYPTGPE